MRGLIRAEKLPRREAFLDSGVLVIDKPSGLTSMDVIRELRKVCYVRRMGHGGTLDPFATGVLPILINDATKLSDQIMAGDKVYEGSLFLGLSYDTQDMTGQPLHEIRGVPPGLTEQEVQHVATTFEGEILQRPPAYSAVKRQGKPLYAYAREGHLMEGEPRPVKVYQFAILNRVSEREFQFRVKCSKGTYVRTLVHDLGQKLDCGAVTQALRRTQTSRFHIDEAVQLSTLAYVSDIKSHLKQM